MSANNDASRFVIESESNAIASENSARQSENAKSEIITIKMRAEASKSAIEQINVDSVISNATKDESNAEQNKKYSEQCAQDALLSFNKIKESIDDIYGIIKQTENYKNYIYRQSSYIDTFTDIAMQHRRGAFDILNKSKTKHQIVNEIADSAASSALLTSYWARIAKGNLQGVNSFNSKKGAVLSSSADYTADMIGAMASNAKIDWDSISSRPRLSVVARSGSYNDLKDIPSTFTGGRLNERVTGDKNFYYPFSPQDHGLKFGGDYAIIYDSKDKVISIKKDAGTASDYWGINFFDSGSATVVAQGTNLPRKVFTELNPPTADQVGARPNNWMPKLNDVNALAISGEAVNAKKIGGYRFYTGVVKRNYQGNIKENLTLGDDFISNTNDFSKDSEILHCLVSSNSKINTATLQQIESEFPPTPQLPGKVPINACIPINSKENKITSSDGTVWLKSGAMELDVASYPDAKVLTAKPPVLVKSYDYSSSSTRGLDFANNYLYFSGSSPKKIDLNLTSEITTNYRDYYPDNVDLGLINSSTTLVGQGEDVYILGQSRERILTILHFKNDQYIKTITVPSNDSFASWSLSGDYIYASYYSSLYKINITEPNPTLVRLGRVNAPFGHSSIYVENDSLIFLADKQINVYKLDDLRTPIATSSKLDFLVNVRSITVVDGKFFAIKSSPTEIIKLDSLGIQTIDVPAYNEAMPNIPNFMRIK